MKSGVFLAIFASLVLVGGSVWMRSTKANSPARLVTVADQKQAEEKFEEAFLNFVSDTGANNPSEVAPSSRTDLIGQNLIADYLALAAQGDTSKESLESLGEKYVESISGLVSAEVFTHGELKPVANNKSNFEKYSLEVGTIYREYAAGMIELEGSKGIADVSMGPAFSKASEKMGALYQKTANALKTLSVPVSLAQNHLELINVYQKNAAAMFSMSKAESDPASAFAGIILISNNINSEAELWVRIQKILNSNGV